MLQVLGEGIIAARQFSQLMDEAIKDFEESLKLSFSSFFTTPDTFEDMTRVGSNCGRSILRENKSRTVARSCRQTTRWNA